MIAEEEISVQNDCIKSGGNLTMKAPTVRLLPGFKVEKGGKLKILTGK